jgi:hypothetical protein
MRLILICFVGPFVFFYDLFFFKLFNKKVSKLSYDFFIFLFCLTGGWSSRTLDFFFSKPRKNIYSSCSDILNLNEEVAKKSLSELGFYYADKAISDKDIIEIKNYIKNLKGKYISDYYSSKEYEFFNPENPKGTRFYYNSNDLIECNNIQKIIVDNNLYKIISNYFQKEPIMDNIRAWWTVPSEKADSSAAQLWHFDLERTKWLKIFIYLTDCTEMNGPHYFIQRSHKDGGIPFSIRKRGYSRAEDELVDKVYQKKDIKSFTSPAGGLLLEDTRGLHKGKKVDEGSRLILQLQFTTNLFGSNDMDSIFYPINSDIKFEEYQKHNKFFFSNFVKNN